MAICSFSEFDEMHKSFLQEMCNLGAGNAATAISEMIASPTDISTPEVNICPVEKVCEAVKSLSSGTEAYFIHFSGDVRGSILFLFPRDFIDRLLKGLMNVGKIKSREEMVSSVCETANISAASYANNFAMMAGMEIDISVPSRSEVPEKELLSVITADPSAVCFIKNTMEIVDCHKYFDLIFFPELDTMKDFMGRIGLEC